MRRKQWSVSLCLVVVICYVATPRAAAHVLAQDKTTSAVLHILPDDAPVAGQMTRIQFDFAGSGFDIKKCNCQLSVMQDTRAVTTVPIESVKSSATLGGASITFPEAAVYSLQVNGRTVRLDRSFQLEYVVRVTGVQTAGASRVAGQQAVLISLTSLVLYVMFVRRRLIDGGRYAAKT